MFRSIKGYEGKYSVNEMGEVMNDKTGRILKPGLKGGNYKTKKGGKYLFVFLYLGKNKAQKYLHRLVAETFLAPDPTRIYVDHIDGDKINNNLSNLRWVTRAENLHNVKTAKGYCYRKKLGKWEAQIQVNNKQIFLGLHPTKEEARQAYLDGKKIYHPSSPIK